MSRTKERVNRGHGNEESGETTLISQRWLFLVSLVLFSSIDMFRWRGNIFPKGPPGARGSPKRAWCMVPAALSYRSRNVGRVDVNIGFYLCRNIKAIVVQS